MRLGDNPWVKTAGALLALGLMICAYTWGNAAMQKARADAAQTRCISNLRTIWVAAAVYVSDWNGLPQVYPRHRVPHACYWHRTFRIKRQSILRCPADIGDMETAAEGGPIQTVYGRYGTSYLLATQCFPAEALDLVNTGRLPIFDPSMPMFFDAEGFWHMEPRPETRQEALLDYPNWRVNVVRFDGSAATMGTSELLNTIWDTTLGPYRRCNPWSQP